MTAKEFLKKELGSDLPDSLGNNTAYWMERYLDYFKEKYPILALEIYNESKKKKMKIKITNGAKNHWYENLTGSVFTVSETCPDTEGYLVETPERNTDQSHIYQRDCEEYFEVGERVEFRHKKIDDTTFELLPPAGTGKYWEMDGTGAICREFPSIKSDEQFERLMTAYLNGHVTTVDNVFDVSAIEAQREKIANKEYDFVNPSHYKKFGKETYQMMIDIWGKEAYIAHCEMCAFKYKLRAGEKPDQPVDRDLDKANWYLEMANKLKNEVLD